MARVVLALCCAGALVWWLLSGSEPARAPLDRGAVEAPPAAANETPERRPAAPAPPEPRAATPRDVTLTVTHRDRPVPSARATLTPLPGIAASAAGATANGAGRIRLPAEVRAGAYRLEVSAPGLPRVLRNTWRPRDETIALPPERVLYGRVVDEAGEPVPGLWITRGGDVVGATNDWDGRFRQAGPGKTVGIKMGERIREWPVPPDGDEMTIVFDPGPRIFVRVAELSGRVPLVRATLTERGPGTTWVHRTHAEIGPDGIFRSPPLGGPGKHVLFARTADGERLVFEDDLVPGGPVREAALKPALAITGDVVLPPGTKATTIAVVAQTPFLQLRADAGEDGRFRLDGLPPGTYDLTVNVWNEGHHVRTTTHTVSAGAHLTVR